MTARLSVRLPGDLKGRQRMNQNNYQFTIESSDEQFAGQEAVSLADDLREVAGVSNVQRRKASQSTMDLGAIVTIIASSGATLAVARGIADWLRARRGTRLRIEIKEGSRSIKAEVDNIDPEAAGRIVEDLSGA
jgi:Effector Associated Constant Component 1